MNICLGIDHPYGKYSTEKDFNNLTRADVVDFYESIL